MKRNNIISKYYYHTSVKKKILLIWIILISPVIIFSQKQTSIQPLPAQKSLPLLNNNKPEINTEYEKALKEYELLLKKYPDKKLPKVEIVKEMEKRHSKGESLEDIINNYEPK